MPFASFRGGAEISRDGVDLRREPRDFEAATHQPNEGRKHADVRRERHEVFEPHRRDAPFRGDDAGAEQRSDRERRHTRAHRREAVGSGDGVGPCARALTNVDEKRTARPGCEDFFAAASEDRQRFRQLRQARMCEVEASRRRTTNGDGERGGDGCSGGDSENDPRGLEHDEEDRQEDASQSVCDEIREPLGERSSDEVTAVEELRQRFFVRAGA